MGIGSLKPRPVRVPGVHLVNGATERLLGAKHKRWRGVPGKNAWRSAPVLVFAIRDTGRNALVSLTEDYSFDVRPPLSPISTHLSPCFIRMSDQRPDDSLSLPAASLAICV